MTAGRLVLVRHGRTAWNAEGRFQGHADQPLDEIGHAQAARTAAELAGWSVVAVVSSDLLRARETAAYFAAAGGAPVTYDRALREVDLGTWEGMTATEAERRHPAEFRDWSAGIDVRRGGGETLADAGHRAATVLIAAFDGLPSGSTVIAISHGLVLQAAMAQLVNSGIMPEIGPLPHLANGAWLEIPMDFSRNCQRPLSEHTSSHDELLRCSKRDMPSASSGDERPEPS